MKHVEFFRPGGVGTSIPEDLDIHPANGKFTPLLHPQSRRASKPSPPIHDEEPL